VTVRRAACDGGPVEAVELTDGVVVLRMPDQDDVDRITVLCQDAEVQRWTVVPIPYRREDAESFLARIVVPGLAAGTSFTWGVRDAATDRLDGMIGLTMEPASSAEIGYWLGPEARGRGLMSRAVALVLDHAFSAGGLGLERVSWCAVSGNTASRVVAERAGFLVEGLVRGYAVQRGVRHDAWLGTVLASDRRQRGARG
jgi:RimJ/RimL family protein N-acetyltransferase